MTLLARQMPADGYLPTLLLEGNGLTFAEAQTMIDAYRQRRKTQATYDTPQP